MGEARVGATLTGTGVGFGAGVGLGDGLGAGFGAGLGAGLGLGLALGAGLGAAFLLPSTVGASRLGASISPTQSRHRLERQVLLATLLELLQSCKSCREDGSNRWLPQPR